MDDSTCPIFTLLVLFMVISTGDTQNTGDLSTGVPKVRGNPGRNPFNPFIQGSKIYWGKWIATDPDPIPLSKRVSRSFKMADPDVGPLQLHLSCDQTKNRNHSIN